MGIKIITDNCCDLPDNLIKKYDIGIVNLLVRFGDRVYQPSELDNAAFYEKMRLSRILPQTSQPAVEEMTRAYSEALADESEVIAIHMSSGISGTFHGGQVAKKMLDNPRLHMFDSKKASVGLGLMVVEAARMAEQGDSLRNIMGRLTEMQQRLECIFVVGSMENLIKGGRISRAKGIIADVLDIKPVLHFDQDGYIVPYDKARGYKLALRKIINIMEKIGADLSSQTIGIVHGASPETANYLSDVIREKFGVKEIIIGEIGPVLGSHVGAGTFSVFFET